MGERTVSKFSWCFPERKGKKDKERRGEPRPYTLKKKKGE